MGTDWRGKFKNIIKNNFGSIFFEERNPLDVIDIAGVCILKLRLLFPPLIRVFAFLGFNRSERYLLQLTNSNFCETEAQFINPLDQPSIVQTHSSSSTPATNERKQKTEKQHPKHTLRSPTK